jgi:cytochrome c oxidase subunit 2
MTILLGILCLALLVIVIVQIGKVTELAGRIRGEEDAQRESDYWNSRLGVAFMVVFLLATVVSALYYKNFMLGYGPHQAASEHGSGIDTMFSITLFFTGIVFIITHIALFWFAYKYRYNENRKALFNPHDNRLEIIWTIIPAIVMTILVVYGLDTWNTVMADVDPNEEYIEIEATGMQFAWILRYAGEDGELGARDYRQITGVNPLGQVWEDEANHDDFQPSDIVLPVGKKVRVRITARDVLHNFYLPHFRVKMDAVPGMPTYFVFTPTKTTEEYRQELSRYAEYQVPVDPNDPESPMLWEQFNYELACAELCGSGHFSMRKLVKIVSQEEYDAWVAEQPSYYLSNVRGTDDDPYKGDLLGLEVEEALSPAMTSLALLSDVSEEEMKDLSADDMTVDLNVDALFMEGSSELSPVVEEKLSMLATSMTNAKGAELSLTAESDDLQLNDNRIAAIKNYLGSQGIDITKITNASLEAEEL